MKKENSMKFKRFFALAINSESSLSIMLNQEMISTTLLKARPFTRFWKIKSSTRMHCKIT